MYPLVAELAADGGSRHGVVPGIEARPPALLLVAEDPDHRQ